MMRRSVTWKTIRIAVYFYQLPPNYLDIVYTLQPLPFSPPGSPYNPNSPPSSPPPPPPPPVYKRGIVQQLVQSSVHDSTCFLLRGRGGGGISYKVGILAYPV